MVGIIKIKEQLMSTHFFHYNNREVKIEFDTSSDGTPNFDLSSDKESQVHIFMDREQLEQLAYKIHEYLILTDIRERSLAKALPDPPEVEENEIWL